MPPTRRRPQGTGGLFQRADGMWIGRVEAGTNPDGTRRRRQVAAKTKGAAIDRLRALQQQVSAGQTTTTGTATVKSWAAQWLPLHAVRVRPSTYATDAGTVRKWIIPTIGHRRLADLTPADLRALRTAIVSAGRSSTTAHHSHAVLVKMLRDAIVEGYIVPPRVLAVPKPAKAPNDRTAIPVEDALKILTVAHRRPDAARWVAALLQGMRQGETLGLTWDHVDLDTRTIDISWQLQSLTRHHASPDGWQARHLTGTYWLTPPKTAKGRRVIPLVPWMHAALVKTRDEWRPNPWGLVWTTDVQQPIGKRADMAAWQAIQEQAGVAHPSGRPWTIHECRHTTATLLMRSKVDRSVIEAIIGQAVLVESYLHAGRDDALAALQSAAAVLHLEGPVGT